MANSVYLLSLGCDKNKVDGEVMLGQLLDAGCTAADDPAEAQVIIVNTCGFIREAVQESIDLILEIAAYKQTGICEKLIIVGCMTERYKEEAGEELPEVDAVLGVADRERIVEVVQSPGSGAGASPPPGGDTLRYRLLARKTSAHPHIAHVKIAEGCDNRCTYCTIPTIRGGYISRPQEEILKECRALLSDGVREIVLVAQDTARYGVDLYREIRLPGLLEELNGICAEYAVVGVTAEATAGTPAAKAPPAAKHFPPAPWIRLMYAYPEHISRELIDAMARLPHVCKYLDMPIQHSEDTVLARMGRKGTREGLRGLIVRLRRAMPDITLRTTLMTGFPGESAKEFDGMYRFCEETRFDRLGVFPYSREEGTPAATMPQQLSEKTKHARRDRLMELQQEIHRQKQREKIGTPLAVMCDGNDPNGDNPHRYVGRTSGDSHEVDAAVYFFHEDELQAGDVVTVVPTDADEYDLYG